MNQGGCAPLQLPGKGYGWPGGTKGVASLSVVALEAGSGTREEEEAADYGWALE